MHVFFKDAFCLFVLHTVTNDKIVIVLVISILNKLVW